MVNKVPLVQKLIQAGHDPVFQRLGRDRPLNLIAAGFALTGVALISYGCSNMYRNVGKVE
eukprot:EC714830.1.p3 GENE.EC714830.1~~EC714830.1.p3  ORF type:complete len:60 (+),score=10.31 EC714830.1:71-250(+)